jgi:hypothetical protein
MRCSPEVLLCLLRVRWFVACVISLCIRVGEKLLYLTGPLFVIFAALLIIGVMYVHFVTSIPFYAPYR